MLLLKPLFEEDTPEHRTPGHVSDATQLPKGDLASDTDTPFSPQSRRQGVAGSTTGSRGQWDRAGEEAPTCPQTQGAHLALPLPPSLSDDPDEFVTGPAEESRQVADWQLNPGSLKSAMHSTDPTRISSRSEPACSLPLICPGSQGTSASQVSGDILSYASGLSPEMEVMRGPLMDPQCLALSSRAPGAPWTRRLQQSNWTPPTRRVLVNNFTDERTSTAKVRIYPSLRGCLQEWRA